MQASIYALFMGLSWLACRLPRRLALSVADGFALLVYTLYRLTPYRGFVAANVRSAFPDATEAWVHRIARDHVRLLAKAIAEILRFPRPRADDLLERVRFEGWEHVESARSAGRGVIIATAHFGNWELLGAALSANGLPLHVLVQPPSQDAFGRLFAAFRSRVGVSTWPNAGPASLRPALRALARGEALGVLADQHGEAQDAIVRLFGHRVSAPIGPTFFAGRTGAAVLPVFIIRQPDDTHLVRIYPELLATGDVTADAQALYALYEREISLHPDHWLWAHDRWARGHELRPAPAATAPALVEACR